MRKKSINIVLQSVVLVVIGLVLGLGANFARSEGIPLIAKKGGPAIKNITKVDLAEAKKLYDGKNAVFIDARSPEEYELGHILGAKNLPYDDLDSFIDEVLDGVKPSTPIVTYCSGEGCHSSDLLAANLKDMGFEKIYVFFAGWQKWASAKYPSKKAAVQPLYKLK